MPGRLVRNLHLDGIPGRLWMQALVVFAVVTTLVLSSIGTVVLLRNSQAAKVDRKVQATSLRVLVECTTPPNLRHPPETHPTADDCYVRSQSSTANLIAPTGPLSPLLSAAAACGAAHPGDIQATRECVLKGLAE